MSCRPQEASDEIGMAQAAAPPTPDFAAFFAGSLDLLVIRDSAFRIIKVNPAWEAVLGYRMDELEGRPMLDFIHPDDVPSSHAEMHRVETELDVRGFINRYRCRDGGYRHFEWWARQEGELVYGIARDVTERLAVEAQMAEARAAAEAANKAKSEFLANMSHEIRTPLNGVIGLAGALALTELTPVQREMVELIESSGQSLERVVSDVLDFSKIEAGCIEFDLQPFDLRQQTDRLIELFRPRAEEKGLAISASYGAAAEGWLFGDVVRLKQVLGNLVSNAIKFTAKGEVRVAVDLVERDGPEQVSLVVEVCDTGIGFDAEAAGRLFQRFSQADGSITRRFGGTGLGLAICQALVELMGGEISARSEPGQGSVFGFAVPLPRYDADAPAAAAHADLSNASAADAEPIRVLLAEDHVVNQRVVELILSPAGVELTKVENGAAAVAAYAAGRFALVLMDMQMPVMDGLAATRAIRRFEADTPGWPRTPIVMLSANAMRQHAEDARDAGADLHLAKPVTPASLLDAVSLALGGAGEA